ncbi:MAG: undecaprenyl/decaprenyl-phosphate alpha-N-acetylglucosaminyl 1-phosphate transferase [Oligoflexia bacterium]|nr:undecaprenyl/decaprenyl-phosphate alpha-N-acetylglucosaminyl 1-phosphate transferase [Oligoflexia bacterium]
MSLLLLSLFSAALSAWALTFLARALAMRFSIFAQPGLRRRHDKPIPLLGGVAIFFAVSLIATSAWLAAVPGVTGREVASFLIAMGLVLGTGVADDWLELRARHKLVGESLAAILIMAMEPNLRVIFLEYGVSPWVGYPLTLVWIVGLTNAFNLIDGLDGLCAGIAAISALALVAVLPPGFGSLLAMILAGAAIGFAAHNFNPARIFLGDSGSLLLGFTLAALSLKVRLAGALPVAAAVMVFLFLVPILDTFLAMYRRARQSRSLFAPDRGHLHHRLQNLGLSVPKTAGTLYLVQGYFCLSAWCMWRGAVEWGWSAFLLAMPALAVFVRVLKFTEQLLSQQSARLSYHFLSDELEALADRGPLRAFVREQIQLYEATREGFSVVLMDCSTYLQQILQNHPTRIVNFYVSLYGTIKGRIRQTDLVARPSELVFAIVLSKTWKTEGAHSLIFEFLRNELKTLQEAHGIYQSKPDVPEGFKVLTYPKDRAKILRALNLSDSLFGLPLAGTEESALGKSA